MPHVSFGEDDRFPDIACAHRPRRHRRIGEILMSADIIRIEDATPLPVSRLPTPFSITAGPGVAQPLENGGEDALKLIHRNERAIFFDERGFQNVARTIKR
jgi:hypothetical protein